MPIRLPPRDNEAAFAVGQLSRGRSNCSGEFTCATSSATTTVTDDAIQVGDTLQVTPTTANASAELGSGNFYITTATAAGTITVNHTNSATAGRTFKYRVSE